MNSRFLRNGIVTLVLVVGMATLLYVVLFGPSQNAKTIPYAGGTESFQALVKAGQVANVTQQGTDLEITLTRPTPTATQKVVESQVPGSLGEGLTGDIATWCRQAGATCNNQHDHHGRARVADRQLDRPAPHDGAAARSSSAPSSSSCSARPRAPTTRP